MACNSESEIEKATFTEHTIKDEQVFLSAEDAPYLGRPTAIKAVFDGLYFVDSDHYQIMKVDKEGNHLLSFGNRGRGPGEFQSIAGFWPFKNEYLVYDYNSFKFLTFDKEGSLVEEVVVEKNPVNPDGFPPNIPITVHAISTYELLIPSRGRNGSLFAIADIKTDNLKFTGEAIGPFVESYDHENVIQTFAQGEIPDIFLNLVMMTSSASGIYSFQQTTGKLEKYSHSGELVWQKDLKIPAQNDLFDQIARKNQLIGMENEPRHLFKYATSIDANENGVAVLLNMPDGDPVTAVWVPEDGKRMDVLTFSGLEQEEFRFFESGIFTVNPTGSRAYILNTQDGIIYKAEWPL